MSKILKFVFFAAFVAIGISSPVLADSYDPGLNGGGSIGYDAHLGAGNS